MGCPNCQEVTVCTALPMADGLQPSARVWSRTNQPGLIVFNRVRECQKCGRRFVTAEIPESFLNDLFELRDSLVRLKKKALRTLEGPSG